MTSGVYIRTQKHKDAIRVGLLGHRHTSETKEKCREVALRRKRVIVLENKRLCLCGCGMLCSTGRFYLQGHSAKGKVGNNSRNWKGGLSFLPYCSKFNERLKESVRERDSRKCQICGKTEEENKKKLSVHHVHYDKENCYPDLLSTCIGCNNNMNSNRDYWESRCMKILEERGLLNWSFKQ